MLPTVRCLRDMVGGIMCRGLRTRGGSVITRSECSGGVSNLNSGDTALVCELAFSCAKEGSEVVLDKNQDPNGKLGETLITEYGFRELEHMVDGKVVLALSTDAVVIENSVTVDAVSEPDEESSTSNHRGAAKHVLHDFIAGWTWLPRAVKVGYEYVQPINSEKDQTVWADTYFRRSHCREGDSSTFCVRLVLDEIRFGVENCFTNEDKDKRGFFIYKTSVTATPVGTWKDNCEKISARPSPEGSDFFHEKASMCGLTGSVSASNPVGVTAQRSLKTTAGSKDFEWLPCKVTNSTKAVTWAWEMQSWKGGSPVRLDKDSRVLWGRLPKLPFDPESFGQDPSVFVADAYWEIREMNEEDLGNVEWSIEIQIHYALLERAHKLGNVLSVCRTMKRKGQVLSHVKAR